MCTGSRKIARESQSDELQYLAAIGLGTIYEKTKQLEKTFVKRREKSFQ